MNTITYKGYDIWFDESNNLEVCKKIMDAAIPIAERHNNYEDIMDELICATREYQDKYYYTSYLYAVITCLHEHGNGVVVLVSINTHLVEMLSRSAQMDAQTEFMKKILNMYLKEHPELKKPKKSIEDLVHAIDIDDKYGDHPRYSEMSLKEALKFFYGKKICRKHSKK